MTLQQKSIGRALREYWPLVLCVLLGSLLRLWRLSAHSLLFDEAFIAIGARDIARNLTPMWDVMANAPFVWFISRLVLLWGDSPLLLRLPSALAGIATIAAIYALALRLFDRRVAITAALLFALHPFAIAFSRILFVDSCQILLIVLGWLAIDRFLTAAPPSKRDRWKQAGVITAVWGLAFLAKYNAIVPGMLWLFAGVLCGRYEFRRAAEIGVWVIIGSLLTLVVWPLDAPIWFVAFLEKGGGYDLSASNRYFKSKFPLIFFGLIDLAITASVAMGIIQKRPTSRTLSQLGLMMLLYLTTIIFIGRTFERYLLMLVPLVCIALPALAYLALDYSRCTNRAIVRYALLAVIIVSSILYFFNSLRVGQHYTAYLKNSIPLDSIASDVRNYEHDGHRGFWLVSETVGGYYLGFSQFYSRPIRNVEKDSLARVNFFEFSARPYADERDSYGVLAVREWVHAQTLSQLLFHPSATIGHLRELQQHFASGHAVPQADYLDSNFVRSGDVLIVTCGFRDIMGEPILEEVSGGLPPSLAKLPLDKFSILHVYRPEGRSSTTDTILDPIKAGAWMLIKK